MVPEDSHPKFSLEKAPSTDWTIVSESKSDPNERPLIPLNEYLNTAQSNA